jgi:hypothetical protein
MISEKQLAANRENAQKSTGPKTQAGKERSRLNAFRHGSTGHSRIMPEEEMAAYQRFTTSQAAAFSPIGEIEINLAQQYADFQWRINRCAAIEDTMFTLGFIEEVAENLQIAHPEAHLSASNAKTFRLEAKEFDRLSMYNQRLVNGAAKVFKQLQEVQALRRRREDEEMGDAVCIYKNFRSAGGVFDPQANGFVLTIPKIEAYLRLQQLRNPNFVAEEVKKTRAKAA